jgi:hypothetical protein
MGISNCRTLPGITYKNVSRYRCAVLYIQWCTLKYDFIVQPGADVNNIAMYFEGTDELKSKKGDLHIKTSVDEVVEMAPYTYQLINDKRKRSPAVLM